MVSEVFEKRIKKNRDFLDRTHSEIRHISDMNGIYVGQVKSIYDRTILAFHMQNGEIHLTDLLDSKDSKYDFKFKLANSEMTGKGSRTYYKNCERYVCFVLILLKESLSKKQKDQA